jgi:ketosteroid isomerase-like protein
VSATGAGEAGDTSGSGTSGSGTAGAGEPTADEVRAAYGRYTATRAEVEAGNARWSALAEFFTDDAVFVDPAWGRITGKAAIAEFMDASMAGLDDWAFPEGFTMVEGARVVTFWWNRLAGTRPDGTPYQAPGVSILHYAGDGKFCYELDILNMAEVTDHMRASGWRPPAGMNMPPSHPDRDPTPPDRPEP